MDREEILKNVPIFSGLDKGHLKRLSRLMVERRFGPGEEIMKEGDQAAGFFVVTSGKVEVVRGADGGKGEVLNTLGPGEFFGEMALFEGFPRSATVRALEPTDCLAMTRWDFRAELTSNAEIAFAVLETVVHRLRDADARLTE
jgi:CRP-like cAMP-binding protein